MSRKATRSRRSRICAQAVASMGTSFVLAACANETSFEEPTAEIVVGFSTEGFATTDPIGRVVIQATAGDVTRQVEARLPVTKVELAVEAPPASSGRGASVDVQLSGFGGAALDELRWVRNVRAPFVRGQKRLLRLPFDPICAAPLGAKPTTCTQDTTCLLGACVGTVMNELELERYAPDWNKPAVDVCRTTSGQTPEVQLGLGAAVFLAAIDGQEAELEAGPQGGHHVWLAFRSKHLASRGVLVSLSARDPNSGYEASPATWALGLDPVDGGRDGRCGLAGLRYQVDANGVDHRRFLGKPLEVTLELRDRFGARARGQLTLNIAPAVKKP